MVPTELMGRIYRSISETAPLSQGQGSMDDSFPIAEYPPGCWSGVSVIKTPASCLPCSLSAVLEQTQDPMNSTTQSQKVIHSMYSLISGYYVNMYRIPKKKSTELRKFSKPKGPSEDASVPLGRE